MELQLIQSKIFEIRGVRVMLDYDLAALYQVETKYLKRSVRRNIERFPEDFMFELTKEEYDFLRCNFGTLENSGRGQYSKYLPFAFSEQGVAQLSSVLNSPIRISGIIILMVYYKLSNCADFRYQIFIRFRFYCYDIHICNILKFSAKFGCQIYSTIQLKKYCIFYIFLNILPYRCI